MRLQSIVVAGLAGGSGKSVVSVGLTAALARQGKDVVTFKKGPDYIDAGWLQLAAGRRGYNLDPYLMTEEAITSSFVEHSQGMDVAIVEGNRGLYDGVNVSGGYSTAELSLMLKLPVLLVVNCTKTTRTVAAMVLGCAHFDPRVDIRGVVLNQVATERQKKLVTRAVEEYTGIPVIGSVPRLKQDIFPMRHLGMIPQQEYHGREEAIDKLASLISDNLDLARLAPLMAEISPEKAAPSIQSQRNVDETVAKIGVLQDAAFQFYYSENLEALENAGAELVFLDATRDATLPELDGLYIGGGFPETSVAQLAANTSFRQSLKKQADEGLPVYAECGGLIYLGKSMEVDGREYPLVGIFSVRFGMKEKPQAHGYTICDVKGPNPFYPVGTRIKGHEFRYSTITDYSGGADELCLEMARGRGFADGRDGLVYKNVLAMYTHVHAGGEVQWAEHFISRCRRR